MAALRSGWFWRAAVPVVVAATGVTALVVLPGTIRALHRSVSQIGAADPVLLVAAGGAFLAGAVASALAWHAVLDGCGVRLRRLDVVARYAVGGLANSLAPPPAGEAARIALVGRLVGRPGGALTAGGVWAAVALVRTGVVAVLFAAATFASPAGRVAAVATLSGVLFVGGVVLAVGKRRRGGRLQHFADAGRALRESPRVALRLLGWVCASTAARVAACACCCAALGVGDPVAAGAVVVAALELATMVPLLPANIGVTSAAVTLALQRHHVALTAALSSGIALHAVETFVGISLGLAGTLAIARPRPSRGVAVAVALVVVATAVGLLTEDVV